MTVFVTGAAGFIGHALSLRLLAEGEAVVGLDNFNDYYEPSLKTARANNLEKHARFRMVRGDIADHDSLYQSVQDVKPLYVVHLAAQAGVRYSIEQPFAYAHSNLTGHLSVLEACRHTGSVRHLVYASSSSVYGDRSAAGAFNESDQVDKPVSLYAASKRAGELISESYAKLYDMSLTGLRFFTVYGPWGRPDMAYYSFTRKILAGEPIEIYGEGQMSRDFTYIDDIVDGIVGAMRNPPAPAVNRILNIGDSNPVGLMDMVSTLERALGVEAQKIFKPMQPGDVTSTFADVRALNALTGYEPSVPIETGIPRFVNWYREYYGTPA